MINGPNRIASTLLCSRYIYVFLFFFIGQTYVKAQCISKEENTIVLKASFCAGSLGLLEGSIPTGGNGNYTYIWQVNDDNNCGEPGFETIPGATGPNYSIPSTITRRVCYRRIVRSPGCRDVFSDKLQFSPEDVVNGVAPTATATQPTCATATGSIAVSQPVGTGLTYSINGTDYNNTTGSFTGLAAGTYQVTVRNSEGCTSAATAVVINAAPQAPTGTISPANASICSGGSQLLTVTGGTSYQWRRNDIEIGDATGASYRVTQAGTYSVIITNGNCSGLSSNAVTVDVQDCIPVEETKVIVPTAFTPNRNSANDLLRPVMFNIQELVYFKVFNRWGQMVFQTNEIGKGWDGTLKGVPQPTETYTWILQCIDVDGNIIKQSGRSLLIR